MRNALLTLALLPLIAAPALAQDKVEAAKQRIRSVVIYGDEACPAAADPDEIVVCSRRPADEQFRLAPSEREKATKNRKNRAWAARVRDLDDVGRPINTCTAVGPAGGSGCIQQDLRNAAAEKAEAKTEAAADAPVTATPSTPR